MINFDTSDCCKVSMITDELIRDALSIVSSLELLITRRTLEKK